MIMSADLVHSDFVRRSEVGQTGFVKKSFF
jgi:hypothetical protein